MFPVDRPGRRSSTTHADGAPVLVAGDGAGLVDAAAGGPDRRQRADPVLGVARPTTRSRTALDDGATLVRHRHQPRAGASGGRTVRHTRGYTETADEEPLADDPTDNRLPLFPDAGDDAMTVATDRGGVEAARHQLRQPDHVHQRGAPVAGGRRRPRHRRGGPAPSADARGERIELDPRPSPRTTDHITLTQPTNGARNRYITEVRLRFDGGDPVDVELAPGVARRAGPDRHVPRAHVRDAVDRDPGRLGGRRPPLRRPDQPRLRRDRGRRRPAAPGRRHRACPPTCSTPPAPTDLDHPLALDLHPAAAGPHRHHPPRRGAADLDRLFSLPSTRVVLARGRCPAVPAPARRT